MISTDERTLLLLPDWVPFCEASSLLSTLPLPTSSIFDADRGRESRRFRYTNKQRGQKGMDDWTLEKGETDLTWRGGQIIRLDMTVARGDENMRSLWHGAAFKMSLWKRKIYVCCISVLKDTKTQVQPLEAKLISYHSDCHWNPHYKQTGTKIWVKDGLSLFHTTPEHTLFHEYEIVKNLSDR